MADDIRQLIISPRDEFLAILTTHTVHIALLPDSTHLAAPDTGAMRLKTYTLGPTTHITSQPAIASALWHPLGVNGSCLVTVTVDAVVRIWELSFADRWSFDKPTLAIDLKKLADGTSLDQDFSATPAGIHRGFSPDSVEMEVASACFGARETKGWSPMTLWVAMREGDVYALCPLLPEKWAPPATLIPSLSVSIVSRVAVLEDDPDASAETKRLAQQQLAWMSGIDNQDSVLCEGPGGGPPVEVYTRPSKPGRVPKLQGPFCIELPSDQADDADDLLTDIVAIGPRLDLEELAGGEEFDLEVDESAAEGLSTTVVCLLSSSGRITICLNLDDVEAQWLPLSNAKRQRFIELTNPPSLEVFEILQTQPKGEVSENAWPTFSREVSSRYSFYITESSAISFLSLEPWIYRLDSEMNADTSAGADFRWGLLVNGQKSDLERVFALSSKPIDPSFSLCASTVLRDADLGHFLLSATPVRPVALSFDYADPSLNRTHRPDSFDSNYENVDQHLILNEPRPVYMPSHIFQQKSSLPNYLAELRRGRWKQLLTQPMLLSSAALTIFTEAHKILSDETLRVGSAVAELFRECDRLQAELKGQIRRANELAQRVESVIGDDADDQDEIMCGETGLTRRLDLANVKQMEIKERVERLKKRVGRGRPTEISDREKVWMDEVESLEKAIFGKDEDVQDRRVFGNRRKTQSERNPPYKRYEEAMNLVEELKMQAKEVAEKEREGSVMSDEGDGSEYGMRSSRDDLVPMDVKKRKMEEVHKMLEREDALVTGTTGRLQRLKMEV